MNSFAKKVAQNSLIFFSSQLWEALTSIVVLMILARYLGLNGFGAYAVVFSIVNLIVPFTFMGLREIGIREIASIDNHAEKGVYLGSLLQARFFLLGIAALIISIVLVILRPDWNITLGVVIFYFANVIGSSGELVVSSFLAEEKFQYHLYILIIERISLLIAVGVVALWDLGFYAVFISYAISRSSKTFLALYFLKKHFYSIIFKLDYIWIKRIVKESYLLGLGISTGLGFHHALVIILKQIADAKSAGIFSAYYNVILKCQLLSLGLSKSLMPRIALEAKKNSSKYFALTKIGVAIFFITGMVLASITWPAKSFIINILYGESFLIDVQGFGYLIFLIPFLFTDNILNVAFISKKLAKQFFLCKVTGLILGVSLTVIFIEQFYLNAAILGAVTGKIAATVIMFILFIKHAYLYQSKNRV